MYSAVHRLVFSAQKFEVQSLWVQDESGFFRKPTREQKSEDSNQLFGKSADHWFYSDQQPVVAV